MEEKQFIILLRDCYKQLVKEGKDHRIGFVHLKDLWEKMHSQDLRSIFGVKMKPLTLSEFKNFLHSLSAQDFRKYDLSRGSLAIAHTSRYGIHATRGIYVYFKLRE